LFRQQAGDQATPYGVVRVVRYLRSFGHLIATLVVAGRLGQRGLATTEYEQMNGTKTPSCLAVAAGRPLVRSVGCAELVLSKNQSSRVCFRKRYIDVSGNEQLIRYSNQLTFVNPTSRASSVTN
jgi:hypothetical protein